MAYNLGHVVGPAGKGIQGISKTDTTGLVDTYTITYSDGTTSTFTVTNGESNADVVTEWESTPSDSKVPSEKLTKDSLDDKADSNHTHTGMLTTSDVKDNLTSTDTNKPLSAKQGKELKTLVVAKQPLLVSGTNIKTINNNSLLGSGNIDIQGGGGADVGTFTELQALITSASSGDIIVLDKNYKNTGSESRITIDKPLTIIGNGHILDADEVSGIFNITEDGDGCNINSLIFVNGKLTSNDDDGGAICAEDSCIISDCIFNNNSVKSKGGAINCKISNIIINCMFNNNSSSRTTAGSGGGAIFCLGSYVINCNFTNNKASYGGAIKGTNHSKISNCSFNGNTVTNSGANIYNSNSTSLIIYNCHITEGLYNTVNYDDVNTENIANDLTTTTAGKVLDARQGKALADLIGDAISYINL